MDDKKMIRESSELHGSKDGRDAFLFGGICRLLGGRLPDLSGGALALRPGTPPVGGEHLWVARSMEATASARGALYATFAALALVRPVGSWRGAGRLVEPMPAPL
jgi:hypothetical protein